MIIYYSGTGNSEHIAKRLGAALQDEVLSAIPYMNTHCNPSLYSKTPYIFVCPTYAWRMPRVFDNWMRMCSFDGNRKAYYVMNCGEDIGAADIYTRKLSKFLGLEHMGTAEIVMPENYIAMFSAPDVAESREIISIADEKTDALVPLIKEEATFSPVKITIDGHIKSHIVNPGFYRFYVNARKFYTTDACIRCGQCVTNCFKNNITLVNGKPVWGKDCTHCMACICKCPTEAIEYGKHTIGLNRYTCPED